MAWVMEVFDAFWARLEFLEFDFAITRVDPDWRAVFLQRELFLHVAPGSGKPVSGPLRAAVFDHNQRADQDLFLRPQNLVERPQVLFDVHQVAKDAPVNVIPG